MNLEEVVSDIGSDCFSHQVSSSYHPNTGLGYVPNNELLAFLSLATSGAYLPRAPEVLFRIKIFVFAKKSLLQ